MNPSIQIQSNSIRGEYKDDITAVTMREIHDSIKTVFGTHAADAYIIKDKVPYYTRDGKEVLNSLMFNNSLAMYIKMMMYQAVERQGTKVGDGTTTLTVLYTNLYDQIRDSMQNGPMRGKSLTEIRRVWNETMSKVSELLAAVATKEIDTKTFASMVYTCTQDAALTKKFTETVAEQLDAGAYVMVNKSPNDAELEVVVNNKPLIKAEVITSLFPIKSGEFPASTLFVNGVLDITHQETLDALACSKLDGVPNSVVIICSGTSEVTRNTIRDYMTSIKRMGQSIGKDPQTELNNVIILKVNDLHLYPEDMIEDLVAYIYNVVGIPGLINPITFESLLWQTLKPADADPIENLESFSFDPKHLVSMRNAFMALYPVEYSELQGIRLNKPIEEVSKHRYEELRKRIDAEKSSIKRGELLKRLKSLYGQFVEVNVGSKLLKDGQRKYELVLDAVLSAVNAKTYGALRMNSICAAYCAAKEIAYNEVTSSLVAECASVLTEALEKTLYDMTSNAFPELTYTDFDELLINPSSSGKSHCLTGITNPENCHFKFNLNRNTYRDIFDPDYQDAPIVMDGIEIENTIVEPLPIISTLLENSSMMVELAGAKMFNLDAYIGNYLA